MKIFSKIIFILVFVCVFNISISAAQENLGTVTISYVLDRIQTIASNQIAVWIEDEGGTYVKTLYATKFGAQGGFKKRRDTLPEWIHKSGWENSTPEEVDAVSGATPQSGRVTVVWDLTDRAGGPVSAGTFLYKIEGIISWKNRVVWQGRIDVGGREEITSIASATYFPPEAAKVVITTKEGKEQAIESGLIKRVTAVYTPRK